MDQFLIGAIAMGFGVAALCFLRFWRQTRDRLFALFALALLILAVNRVGLAIFAAPYGFRGDHIYWVRFAAFLLILVAIVDKNRSRKSAGP
ncbi:MAG TPA: DUF5985 family protein [Gemmataceae bacterium]|nr:DUF5985 family protein [Gemmataceae bacterium]